MSNHVISQGMSKNVPPNDTGNSGNKLTYDSIKTDNLILPVLMIACNRADAVKRSLDLVLKYVLFYFVCQAFFMPFLDPVFGPISQVKKNIFSPTEREKFTHQ